MKRRLISFVFLILVVCILGKTAYNSDSFQRKLYPLEYREYIWQFASKYNIDPRFVAAIIYVESRFEPSACSSKDAMGLMQITPNTGKWIASRLGIEKYDDKMLLDPQTNIEFGIWYLDDLRKEFKGDIQLLLAAYNAGRGNVKQWVDSGLIKNGSDASAIPFAETRNYINKVMEAYEHYKKLYVR